MIEKTTNEFLADTESLLIGAITQDNFVKIKTPAGNAILVSENEWNILIDSMKKILEQT